MDSKFIFDQSNLLHPKFEENSAFSAFQSRFPNGNFDSTLNKFNSNGKFDESTSFAKNNFLNIPKVSQPDDKSMTRAKIPIPIPIDDQLIKLNTEIKKKSPDLSEIRRLKKKRVINN